MRLTLCVILLLAGPSGCIGLVSESDGNPAGYGGQPLPGDPGPGGSPSSGAGGGKPGQGGGGQGGSGKGGSGGGPGPDGPGQGGAGQDGSSPGGQGGAGGSPIIDIDPVEGSAVKIVFPLPGATAASAIAVRGTTVSEEPVTAVFINGNAATSDDDFATWHGEVSLQVGDNQIVVIAEGASGPLASTTVSVERFANSSDLTRGTGEGGSQFVIFATALSADQKFAYMADDTVDGIVGVDIATGDRWIVSRSENPQTGSGASLVRPNDISLAAGGTLGLLTDGSVLVSVDLATGNRSVAAGQPGEGPSSPGTGDALSGAIRVAWHPSQQLAYVLLQSAKSIIAVNLTTHERTPVCDQMASGSSFPVEFELDLAHNRALYVNVYDATIYTADLTTGTRGTFKASVASGSDKPEIAVLAERNEVAAWTGSAIVAVDLDTKTSRTVANKSVGRGEEIKRVKDLTASGDLLIALDDGECNARLLAIDPVSGDRVVLSKWRIQFVSCS